VERVSVFEKYESRVRIEDVKGFSWAVRSKEQIKSMG
jgi:hypothetical protein